MGVPYATDLHRRLTEMKAGELQSLLLAVFRERTNRQRPKDVREGLGRRFCRPSDADVRVMHEIDGHFLVASKMFEPIDLSPLAPLGVCTAVGPCDPMKVVATVRNLEVTSDPTNVLAVEAAERRRRGDKAVHFSASHRAVRAQAYALPHQRAHFRLFVMCSMFPSQGSGRAETEVLVNHLRVYQAALASCHAEVVRVSVSCQTQPWISVRDRLTEALQVPVDDKDNRIESNNYYTGLSFKMHVRVPTGEELELGDGGFVSWGAQYLSRSKERTLISALGTELLAAKMVEARASRA